MAKTKSSRRWLKEHHDDEYVLKARREGYRSRAVYKLIEMQEKDQLLKPAMTVIELGAAPGGWTQYIVQKIGKKGKVIALDLLPIDPIPGVEFIQGDFREDGPYNTLLKTLEGREVDLVLSDMAPNISGVDAVDQPRSMYLAELAFDYSKQVLKPGGGLLFKTFQGEGYDVLLKTLRTSFAKVVTRKPKASRARSREVYVLATNFKVV